MNINNVLNHITAKYVMNMHLLTILQVRVILVNDCIYPYVMIIDVATF